VAWEVVVTDVELVDLEREYAEARVAYAAAAADLAHDATPAGLRVIVATRTLMAERRRRAEAGIEGELSV
jgi:hypothetical protein